jgi:polyisoprenyl-phosphate glycosyltransferase
VMFFGGVQLLAIGLLGEYIASLFTEIKRRPLYLVDTTVNM